MMKKIISIMLILIIIVNVSGAVSFADVPYDYTDPKCIDIRRLGNGTNFILKNSKVCGCKKCTLDAVTYSELANYIDVLQGRLSNLDDDIPYATKDSIHCETLKHGSIHILLITEAVAATLFPFGTLGNFIVGIIMVGEAVVGFINQYKQNQYDITIFEHKIQMQNIELILKSISRAIDSKGYKNKNFFIATTNYDRHSAGGAIAQFAKKDRMTYDENFFNEDFFNTLNNQQVKPLLARIEKGDFKTYQDAVYDTKLRDIMKEGYFITVPANVFANAYKLYKHYKNETKEFLETNEENNLIQEFTKKNKTRKEIVYQLLKYFSEFAEKSDSDIMKLIGKGVKEITILLDESEDKKSEDTIATSSVDKNNNITQPQINLTTPVPQVAPAA